MKPTMARRGLMMASSAILGILGLVATFLPAEILKAMGSEPTAPLEIIIQIAGALYFGFAMLNWMARENLIGGIYSRPLVVGNFAHFTIAGIALLKAVSELPDSAILWVLAIVYAVFAVSFGYLMFRHPLPSS